MAARRDARLRARARARREAGGDKGNGKDGGVVPQPIRDIVEVVPGPIKLLLGVLGALAVAFFIRSVFASARARRLDQERKRLLEDVGVLQGALLPDVPPRFGSLTTSVGYRPAEGPAAGGDFYDVFETDSGRVGIIVGDVCGHGRDALAVTALMRYSLRAYLNAGLGPRTALRLAAHSLEKDQDTALTTVVLAEYDSRAGTLSYACAGHEPPILLGPASGKHVTASSSPPVGAGLTTGLRETTLAFPPGSSACFFTDGLVEARKGSKMIGRGELTRIVAGLEPGSSAHVLLERLAGVADRAPDDMAACLIRAEDGAVAPTVERIEELELGPADLTAEVGEKFLAGCGVPARSAAEAVASARTTAAEFGSAILRVTLDGDTGRVKVLPHDPAVAPLTVGAAVNGGPPLTVPTELSA